ncbi:MAG: ABC transporter substrate-binding protein, partial [Thiolinea sp.]
THLSHEPSASIHYQQALGYPTTRALAEEILPFQPDLVITSEYGNPNTLALLEKLGLRIEKLAIAENLEGVEANIRKIARLSGHVQRGEALIADMQQRLQALPQTTQKPPLAAVYDPNGYTVGAQSLRGQMIRLAGWRNAGEELGIAGYGELSLEAMVQLAPDALIDSPYSHAYSRARALSRHPALVESALRPHIISLPSAMTICGGPWTVQGIEQLARERVHLPVRAQTARDHHALPDGDS